MIKISAVMPTRNRDDVIGESIKSIINQTEKNWELIIVDDHSDLEDKTKEVVASFKDDRVKYLVLEDFHGKGIAAARNFGNAMAKGKYIAVADSDDINYQDRFEKSLREFEKSKADLVYGKIDCWFTKSGEITGRNDKDYSERPFNLDDFKHADFIPHPTVMYKKQLAYDFPYNSFFCRAEDYDLMARLTDYGYKFSYVPEPLVKYRIDEDIHKKKPVGLGALEYEQIVKRNRNWS